MSTGQSALDGVTLRTAIRRFGELVRAHRGRLDQINVFPIADRDTGANLSTTIDAMIGAVDLVGNGLSEIAEAASAGAFNAARGNSGVILAQLLDGLVRALSESGQHADGADLVRALRHMADVGPSAVAEPVAGTMLTVAADVADAAVDLPDTDVATVATVVARAARRSVDRTPDLLPVLCEHGVVDAGAAGLALFFDALADALGASSSDAPSWVRPDAETAPAVRSQTPTSGFVDEFRSGATQPTAPRYEVMLYLDLAEQGVDAIAAFKRAWSDVGESVTVAGRFGEPAGGLRNRLTCHIHTDQIGSAIEVALEHGRPSGIRVEDLIPVGVVTHGGIRPEGGRDG